MAKTPVRPEQESVSTEEYEKKYKRTMDSPILRAAQEDAKNGVRSSRKTKLNFRKGSSRKHGNASRRSGSVEVSTRHASWTARNANWSSERNTAERTIKPFAPGQRLLAAIMAVVVTISIGFIFAFGQSGTLQVSGTSAAGGKTGSANASTEAGSVELPSNEEAYEVKSSIILQGDRAMEIFYVSESTLKEYGEELNEFALRVPDSRVFVLLAPTSMEFYAPDDYRTDKHSFVKAMEYAYEPLTAQNIAGINARDILAKHADEYIYFRTDHHWTALGAYYAYEMFCEEAHLTPTKLSKHETGKIKGFVGSLYRYTNAEILKKNPDTVQYYYPIKSTSGTAYDNGDLEGERTVQVINTNVSADNAYLCFIEGDNPVEKFTTGKENGKSIVLIKESYGDAFAPFLMDHYETVWVLDPRKVTLDLEEFVNEHEIDDILFLNYGFAPSNPTYQAALSQMLGTN